MTSRGKCSKSSWSSSPSPPWKHDVFLSFRGEDTRTGLTDHLYHALDGKAIDTYRDTEGLVRGEAIAPGLLKGIEESRFAIIVLSENYATSSWCLDEVAEIVNCHRVRGQTIIPVFYHVQPNHVRNQTGNFGEPFTSKHKAQDVSKVNKWREALTLVADIHPRWELKDCWHDFIVIEEIANEIFKELYQIASKDFVGMASRIKKIQSLLDKCPSDDVCTIGIWGIGGIGKTTLAREFYQSMYDKFEARAFIGNVREEYEKNGMVHLQKRLHQILFNDDEGMHDDHMVTNVLSQRLRSKKVLIILDDVDKLEQVEGLVGNWKNHYDWLGPGSRVIVTTRNNHLVVNYGQNYIYEVDKLNDDEALELLHQRAFDRNGVLDIEYRELSVQVVEYANGHPLTLEVLSPYLKGKTVDEWSNILDELKKHPDDEPIHRTLQVSYNGLEKKEKEIFLDIACFFKGEDLYRVKKILDSCRFYPTIGVRVLLEKCFITIASDKLWMHDMLQDFGQEIVRQESIDMLGKRSRLWNHKDARDVLENYKGTQAVQGIFLSLPKNEELQLSEEKKMLEMRKLRLLKIHNVCNFSECGYLSNELRVLEWHQYPLICMPSSFQPKNLVELNVSNSRIERLWDQETTLSLKKLILLNLSNCEYLVETPDFSKVPSLERLILEGCKRLSAVHPTIRELKGLMLLNLKGCESLDSIPQGICFNFLETFILSGCTKLDRFPEIMGDINCLSQLYLDGTAIKELPKSVERLSSLILLNLRNCKNLLSLPDFICGMTSLRTVDISGCTQIDQLPENIGSLENLEKLDACRTAIRKAPSSIVHLKNLKMLCFVKCGGGGVADGSSSQCSSESNISFQLPSSLSGLSSLTSLNLADCNLQQGEIPIDIGCLSSLTDLGLAGNNFMSLPESICQLSNLRNLVLDNCSKLQSLPKLPVNIKIVKTHDCPMLNAQSTIWPSDEGFSFIDTRKAEEAEGPLTHHFLPMPDEHNHKLLPKFIEDEIYHGENLEFRFPYSRIPDWCSRWNKGSSLRIRLPEKDSSQMWIGFALFVLFLIKKQETFDDSRYDTFCHFYTDEGCLENPREIESFNGFKVGSYGLFVYVPKTRFANQLDKATHIKASISTSRPDVEVIKFGLHVIFNKNMPKFAQDIVDTANEHLNLTSIKHYMHILNEASKLDVVLKPQPHRRPRHRQVIATAHPNSMLRRDLQSLLSIMYQGCHARNRLLFCDFAMKGFASEWYFHHSVGRIVVCYLPTNLFDDKQWVGFGLYVLLTRNNLSCLETTPPLLYIDLHTHGSSILHVKTFALPVYSLPHHFFVFQTPRVDFREELNQCWGVSALFRTSTPDVEVKMCGIRVVYEEDLASVVDMITEIELNRVADDEHGQQRCYHLYREHMEMFLSSVESDEPETRNEEMPNIHTYSTLSSESDEYESLGTNKFLSSIQPVDEYVSAAAYENSVPSDSFVAHSKTFFESSYQGIANSTSSSSSRDSRKGLIHLQIMAETLLYENDWLIWKNNLEHFLQLHISYNVIITLSVKGRIISLVKPFDPFFPYNICFPRKEIPEWFKGWQVNMKRMVVQIPPNLNADNNWRGVAICVSFSVYENPYAIFKSNNDLFRLLCHLRTDTKQCLNPALMFRITKDKFKWLFVHGFIWLTYIPSRLLLAELNGRESCILVEIFNECPGLLTQSVAVRLLYEQDVEEFRKSIIKCTTSFFDSNPDLIRQFVDNENEIPSSEMDHFFTEPTHPDLLEFDRHTLMLSCCPPTEILEWFTHHTSGPSVTMELPPYLYRDGNWIGLAVCAYFSDLEHTTEFDPEIPHYLTCHLETDRVSLHTLHKNFYMLHGVEFMWLSFIPRIWFQDQLNNCNLIEASFASERGGWGAHKCGLRLIYLRDEEEFKQTINHCMATTYDDPDGRNKKQCHDVQEGCCQQTNRSDAIHVELLNCSRRVTLNKDLVPKFTQDLDDTSSTEHLNLTSVEHYMHLLEKESDVKVLSNGPSSVNHLLGTAHQPTSQLRIDLLDLFSRVFFEGSQYARNINIPFSFPFKMAFCWFFHQSVGRFVVSYLPANLPDDKSWVGFILYAALRLRPSDLDNNHLDSESPLLLHIDFHSHGSSISHVKTISGLPIVPYSHQTILFSAPRVFFKQDQLNQCWGVSALFRTSTPNLEVETCGIRAVYDHDMETVNEMIVELQLRLPNEDQECYQEYESLVQTIITAHQSIEHKKRKEEIPIHSSYSSEWDHEANMFLSSTQPLDREISSAYKELSIPLDPVVVHSNQQFLDSSYKLFVQSTLRDSKLAIIHLQIMAESSLFENDFVSWKNNLDDFLERHSSFYIIITLSVKGQIISVLKPFDTFSTYNLCFPRKEILEWFKGYQVSKRTIAIKLPPNLKTDKNWKGIAVCVAFSVNEHPNLILDNELEDSFRVLCHMHTDQGWCLDLAPMFRITKDKFKWSYVGGFIWLTYIPSSLLLPELKGQSDIVIDIYSECPGLLTKNLGVRLLFEQDVEEFRQSISKCLTGFLDNLDTISKFIGYVNEKNPSRADESGSGSKNSKCCVVTQPENMTAEPTFPGKTGMDFDQDMIYNSCFPRTEILDWFIHHSTGFSSVQIQLPSNLYDSDWLGVALCAYFTDDEHPSTFLDNFDPEIPQFLICNFGLETLHLYQITNEEVKKINDGEFIWLSYIPRLWFSDQLKQCSLIEASFASDIGGLWAQKCGLRLLYRHDEEEFKRTISYCMASVIDNKDPISLVKADNERNKKVFDDGHDPQNERLEGADNANRMDKGKQVME